MSNQTQPYRSYRSSWRLLAALMGLIVLMVALVVLIGVLRSALDPYVREAQRLAELRQAQIDSQLSGLDVLVAALWKLAPLAALAFAGMLLWRRFATHEYIKASHIERITRAQVQQFPAGLQSLSYHDSSRPQLPAAAPALPEAASDAPALPGMVDLASLDVRPSKERILLGIDEHGPITVSVPELCHGALLGSTGGGKSNLLRLLLPQLQASGARVALADPHFAPIDPENGDDWRPIAQRLLFAPAIKASEIDELLSFFSEELARRLEKRNKGERVGPPIFLTFDELPVITDLVPDAPARLGKLLREGRKVGLLTVGASQSMLIKEVGGSSALRDQYRTAFYVGGDRKSASAMLDIPERLIDDGPLGQGVVLLRSKATSPARLVRVPYASNEALYQLLGSRADEEYTTDDRPSFGFQPARKTDSEKVEKESTISAPRAQESHNHESPEKSRILALFADGLSIAEIVKALSGATSGARYNTMRAQVEATIRQLVLERR